MTPPGVAVVILTYNEERNIQRAVESVQGWASEIYILDSFSADRTVEIALARDCSVYQRAFEDYSSQRNWALERLPIETEWVFFLDADEWVPAELKAEIDAALRCNSGVDAYMLRWKMMWMGKWMRHGYGSWVIRLLRRGHARFEDRAVNERLIVEGKVGKLKGRFVHEDQNGAAHWVAKHVRYATSEAQELRVKAGTGYLEPSLTGGSIPFRRWLRYRVYARLPLFVRGVASFLYCYLVRGGFLDGRPAFVFHLFHALWYPLLTDVLYWEQRSDRG